MCAGMHDPLLAIIVTPNVVHQQPMVNNRIQQLSFSKILDIGLILLVSC
jgi:hypothetical protein